jgi:hypothetical protein
MALWDGPRQCEAYGWFARELPDLRTAFRWAADHNDLDTAAAIATYSAFLGLFVENFEPVTWAEELIELACADKHPRLAFLYAIAALCYFAGRIEEGVRYIDASQMAMRSCRGEVPYGILAYLGGVSGHRPAR